MLVLEAKGGVGWVRAWKAGCCSKDRLCLVEEVGKGEVQEAGLALGWDRTWRGVQLKTSYCV